MFRFLIRLVNLIEDLQGPPVTSRTKSGFPSVAQKDFMHCLLFRLFCITALLLHQAVNY